MSYCANCGKNIQSDMEFCPSCGHKLGGAGEERPIQDNRRNVSSGTSTAGEAEPTYYSDGKGVRVTPTRLMIGSTTYSMANITTITTTEKPANRGFGIFLCFLGVIVLVVGLAVSSIRGVGIGIGVVILLIGIIAAAVPKPTYAVRVSSAAGEVDALETHNRAYIEQVVRALNEALIKRG